VDLSDETRLRPAAHTSLQPLDDRAVLVDLRTGRCWELNKIAFTMWRLLAEGQPVSAVAVAISTHYTVAEDVARRDVLELARSLVSEGLAVIGAPAPTEPAAP
jgi:Coenzyme PQQ synthesis protein D (PqqD)